MWTNLISCIFNDYHLPEAPPPPELPPPKSPLELPDELSGDELPQLADEALSLAEFSSPRLPRLKNTDGIFFKAFRTGGINDQNNKLAALFFSRLAILFSSRFFCSLVKSPVWSYTRLPLLTGGMSLKSSAANAKDWQFGREEKSIPGQHNYNLILFQELINIHCYIRRGIFGRKYNFQPARLIQNINIRAMLHVIG